MIYFAHREITWPCSPMKDCYILEFFVWEKVSLRCGSEIHILRALITDRCGFLVYSYGRRYSISYHWRNKCKEVPEACHFRRYLQELNDFLLCFLTSPHLWSMKGLEIQTWTRWLFWDLYQWSLPSFWSADSLNKVVFCASIPCLLDLFIYCAESRVNLDFITNTCHTLLCIFIVINIWFRSFLIKST